MSLVWSFVCYILQQRIMGIHFFLVERLLNYLRDEWLIEAAVGHGDCFVTCLWFYDSMSARTPATESPRLSVKTCKLAGLIGLMRFCYCGPFPTAPWAVFLCNMEYLHVLICPPQIPSFFWSHSLDRRTCLTSKSKTSTTTLKTLSSLLQSGDIFNI